MEYVTAVPIENLELDTSKTVQFANGLSLRSIPSWIAEDKMLDSLSEHDRDAVRQCRHALVAIYEATALGEPDPSWKGTKPRSIQDSKYELCVLANLAMWLARPTPARFRIILHAPDFGGTVLSQQMSSHQPLLCHPDDADARVTLKDLALATVLHTALAGLSHDSTLWTVVRAVWAGLQMNLEPVRYALFWIGLEALFGAEDAREITYRLSQRAALFIGKDGTECRAMFAQVKAAYAFRSKIMHGRWKADSESTARMAEVETLLRRGMIKVLEDPGIRQIFSGGGRESFLEGLAFGGS
jgi:Apea-like HEPN